MSTNQNFTSLPVTSNAALTDVICAVQGYVSTSSPGVSVQETLQQVYDLFQQNFVLYSIGNPNGQLAGKIYQLCWDTSDEVLYVCTVSGTDSTAVWVATQSSARGQTVSSQVSSSSAISLTTNTVSNITSISLTPGYWYVLGNVSFITTAGVSQMRCWISTASATMPDSSLYAALGFNNLNNGSAIEGIAAPGIVLNVSSTTPVYLSAFSIFEGTQTACGNITAIRVY
jgi:hypothetical protein